MSADLLELDLLQGVYAAADGGGDRKNDLDNSNESGSCEGGRAVVPGSDEVCSLFGWFYSVLCYTRSVRMWDTNDLSVHTTFGLLGVDVYR